MRDLGILQHHHFLVHFSVIFWWFIIIIILLLLLYYYILFWHSFCFIYAHFFYFVVIFLLFTIVCYLLFHLIWIRITTFKQGKSFWMKNLFMWQITSTTNKAISYQSIAYLLFMENVKIKENYPKQTKTKTKDWLLSKQQAKWEMI